MVCRKSLVLTMLSLLLVCILTATTTPTSSPTIQKMNQMPLSFTKNIGQWDDRVLFRANAGGATMWFTKEGVTYQFTRRIGNDNTPLNPLSRGDLRAAGAPNTSEGIPLSRGDSLTYIGTDPNEPIPLLRGARGVSDKDSIEQMILTAKFIGANENPEIIAEGQMEYKCNYFLGDDSTEWRTDVPNYEGITLKDIYPGIDLKYSGGNDGLAAYEFVVASGADIAQIKVEYKGAEETSIDADGRMIVRTKWGDMIASLKTPATGIRTGSCAWWTSSSTTSPHNSAHGDVRQAR